MRLAVSILVVLGVLAGTGCRRRPTAEDSRQEIAEAFGQLPGLTETPHPKLRDELARIVEEGATPELLARCDIPEEENVARGLAGLFDPSEIPSILDASSAIFPAGPFVLNPADLERAIAFRRQHEVERRRAREALARPSCKFPIQYEAGFAADVAFIDVVRICARLEAFHAAESLAGGDVAAAIESLGYMLRLAACLAAEKHTTARLQAAFLRAEALAVLQAVVGHPEISRPKITREQLGRLCAMLQEQLKAWPPDAGAWIGDRALGMHAYELVRAGRLTDLLTVEEATQFADEGILRELPAAAQRTASWDELYYLEAMRKIIDACTRPYHERTAVFAAVREDLHEKRNSDGFPVVAGRLLLVDIEKGHAIQARDRADCEAWTLALALASGKEPPPYQINPLTGREYEVARKEGLVMVSGVGPGDEGITLPVVVPDLAGKGSEP